MNVKSTAAVTLLGTGNSEKEGQGQSRAGYYGRLRNWRVLAAWDRIPFNLKD